MRKKGKAKYFFVIFLCFFIFIYGFIEINLNKRKIEREESKFTMDLKLKPFDFRIETKEYVFYINSKIIDNVKEECINVYNGIISK